MLLVYLHFAIVLAQTFGVVGRVFEVHLVFNLSDNVGFSAIVPCEPVLIIREALIFHFRVLLHFFMNLLFKALGTRAIRFSIDFRIFSYAFVIRRATFFTRSGFSYARSLKKSEYHNFLLVSHVRRTQRGACALDTPFPSYFRGRHLVFCAPPQKSALPCPLHGVRQCAPVFGVCFSAEQPEPRSFRSDSFKLMRARNRLFGFFQNRARKRENKEKHIMKPHETEI